MSDSDGEIWGGAATDPVHGFHLGDVTLVNVHPREACEADGFPCVLHSPSEHHMREWPTLWRADRRLMERICPCHGIGHPDPDDLAFHRRNGRGWQGVHGCVFPPCCRPAEPAPDPCPGCGGSGQVNEMRHADDCPRSHTGECGSACPVFVRVPCPVCR